MDYFKLIADLHMDGLRQGPGGEYETKLALKLAGIDKSRYLKIADIGCGTGATAILLANELNAGITAVDFIPEFLDKLMQRAFEAGVSEKITVLNCSMDNLPFECEEFDVIISEGAVYNMGFENGISSWYKFLKPGGTLIVSEITWTTAVRPKEIESHWQNEYKEIDTASSKIALLEKHGYRPEAYFVLPERCWNENYYIPMTERFDDFLQRHNHSSMAMDIVESEKLETELYQQYKSYYSYGFYIAKI